MQLTHETMRGVYAWFRECYPNEGCGLIDGDGRWVPVANVSPRPETAFLIAPGVAQAHGARAILHSHPNDWRCPSHTDMEAQAASGLPWGIVTNKAGWLAEPVVAQLGFAANCRCLISGDSTPHPKPAPDGLLLAARKIGVAPEACVYVGDDLRDVVAGRAAGMPTIAAGWGYLGADPDLSKWQADAIAPTPADVLALINARRAA
mgnify:CR=1 FL=1